MVGDGWDVGAEEMQLGGAQPLPAGKYRAQVEEATVEYPNGGTQLVFRLGNLRTPEGAGELQLPNGSSFRIGERKVFDREWWTHDSPKAQNIGRARLARFAVALGLMEKPQGSARVVFPFSEPEAAAAAFRGKEVLVVTKLRAKKRKTGAVLPDGKPELALVMGPDGQPQFDPEVVGWDAL